MSKSRNESVDIAKGIGILLVVFGHTMSPVMEGHNVLEWLYSVIYVFHMPLFFFISGFVATKLVSKPLPKVQLLKQRVVRLMLPYLTWAIIYLPMKALMSEHVRFSAQYKWYSFFLGNNPDGQLWFLYVLFLISVFMILFVTQKNIGIFTVIFMIVSVFAPLIPFSIGFTSITLNFSLYQIGFFFAGTLIALKFDYYKIVRNHFAFAISVLVFISYSIMLFINKNTIWYLQTLVAVCAVYACLYLSVLLTKTKVQNLLSGLGKKSMEIYILHGPLLVAGRIVLTKFISNTYLYIFALSLLAVLISVALSLIINKIKFAKLLLFGSK